MMAYFSTKSEATTVNLRKNHMLYISLIARVERFVHYLFESRASVKFTMASVDVDDAGGCPTGGEVQSCANLYLWQIP